MFPRWNNVQNTMSVIISLPMTSKFMFLQAYSKLADYALNDWQLTEIERYKSEFIVFGSKCLRNRVNISHFRIENYSIVPASKVCNLDAYFDMKTVMEKVLKCHFAEIKLL